LQQNFTINGMTCVGCQHKVKHLISQINGVSKVEVNLESKLATIETGKLLQETDIENALKEYPKYTIGAKVLAIESLNKKIWWQTYKPVLLIFIYLFILASLYEIKTAPFIAMRWTNHFMAGFFLIFSFFKLLNLKGFATSYAMYDVVAMRFKPWGYIYPFIELGLGIAMLFNFESFITNVVCLAVMTVSLIGVLQSVLNKRKIKCACLGDVFNLPMSTVTIIEDGLMIAMSVYMLLAMK
jgi:copper chaperone CopZ